MIDGIPFAMSPMPLPRHQWVAGEMRSAFSVALKKTGCKKCKAYDPLDYKVADDIIVQPDILIVCDKVTKPFLDFPPVLVVEILSPSTALRDRHTKFIIYQEAGIKYYIIVDIDKEVFELYELKDGRYMQMENDLNEPVDFTLDEACTISVMLREIW